MKALKRFWFLRGDHFHQALLHLAYQSFKFSFWLTFALPDNLAEAGKESFYEKGKTAYRAAEQEKDPQAKQDAYLRAFSFFEQAAHLKGLQGQRPIGHVDDPDQEVNLSDQHMREE